MSDSELYEKTKYNPAREDDDWKQMVGRLFWEEFRASCSSSSQSENFNEIEFLLSKPDVVNVLVEMSTRAPPPVDPAQSLCYRVFNRRTMLIYELLRIMLSLRLSLRSPHLSQERVFSNGCRIITLLLENGVDINFVPPRPPIVAAWDMFSVPYRDTPLIFSLRVGVAAPPSQDPPPFHVENMIETLKFLIDNGADVNVVNWYGQTPLHVAVEGQHTSVIELLLEHGAQPGIEDNRGISIPDNPMRDDEIIKINIEFVKNFIETEIAYKKLALMKHGESHSILGLLELNILQDIGKKLDELSPDKILLRRVKRKVTSIYDNTGIYCGSDKDCIDSPFGKYCGEDKRCKPRRGGGGKKSKKRKSKRKSNRKPKRKKTKRKRR